MQKLQNTTLSFRFLNKGQEQSEARKQPETNDRIYVGEAVQSLAFHDFLISECISLEDFTADL